MNPILQKRIEEASQQCATTTDGKIISFAYLAAKQMADWLLQNQWISVDEGLPDYGKDVFVRFISRFPNNSEEYEIGYCVRWRTKDKTVKTDSNGFSIIGDMEITHWMKIPPLEGGEK